MSYTTTDTNDITIIGRSEKNPNKLIIEIEESKLKKIVIGMKNNHKIKPEIEEEWIKNDNTIWEIKDINEYFNRLIDERWDVKL